MTTTTAATIGKEIIEKFIIPTFQNKFSAREISILQGVGNAVENNNFIIKNPSSHGKYGSDVEKYKEYTVCIPNNPVYLSRISKNYEILFFKSVLRKQ